MVDRRGNAPRTTILQGSSAPLCAAHDARTMRAPGVELVERRGNAPRAPILRGSAAPLCSSRWCLDVVSSHALLRFGQALSPDQLSRRIGAGAGNRNRSFGVALRGSTFKLRPHGGKWRESNFLPQRDGVYSAATAPAVLIGTSRSLRARPARAELAEGEGVEPSTFPLARFSRPVARRRAPPS